MLPAYAELHCLSNFTFLRGASHAEELVERAKAAGYAALALTDECSLAGAVRAHLAAKEAGLPLILGTELRIPAPAAIAATKDTCSPPAAPSLHLVLLATDRASYGNLCSLITRGRRRATKGTYALALDDVEALNEGCLALWVPPRSFGRPRAGSTNQPGTRAPLEPTADPKVPAPAALSAHTGVDAPLAWLARIFPGRAWIAVELLHEPGDRDHLAALQALSARIGVPLVAAGDVHMHVRARRALQDTLTAVRLKTPIAQCGYALFSNGERHLRSRARLASIYPKALLSETVEIAGRCRFSLDELRYEYPEELVPPGETPAGHLRRLVDEGLVHRFGNGNASPPHVRELIEHELSLIAELKYEPYFLTVHDIVAFARSRGILCQGRGSAANSAVCYALGITEVDPSRMSMLFERFLSRERNEPPDIDVDFEHQRREEVMQYVYDKYGRDRAALAATLITYRTKSAIRDVGKALGMDLAQVDRLAKSFILWDRRSAADARVREAGFDPGNAVIRRLFLLTDELIGFPRHLSQHVGGFVISRGPLERMVPIENAAMADRTVIEWDKDDLDALGLLKVDCLALGMLSAIRRALDMVSAFRSTRLRMQDIPAEDPAVYAMIQKADTVGVFQIESRAQMSMLPRLRPAAFYDLVIEVAIVRPGPIQGGMVHPYLRRRQGKEDVTYPSAAVKSVLERTLGVPIFQEQVMQLAIVAAGFTPGEADQLRRSMAAWRRRGGLEKFEQRLVDGMGERGYREEFARAIFEQIKGFGEYGFPESHSASFALLVYVSCWLKHYEPAAFCGALINSQPMGFYAPAQLVADARRHGVEVRPVDVTKSEWDCTLEAASRQPSLRLGLRMIAGLCEDAASRIVAARTEHPFSDVDDLARRATLNRHDLRCLADAGALAPLAGHRHDAAWAVAGIERLPPILAPSTFVEVAPDLAVPTEGQDIVADYRAVGLTLHRHPLALLRTRLARMRLVTAAEVQAAPHGRLVRTAGIVTCRQRPDTASGVVFVTLEDETGFVNIVVWRNLVDRQRRELLGARLLGVHGRIEREGEVVHVIAGHLVDHSPLLGRLAARSRDFH